MWSGPEEENDHCDNLCDNSPRGVEAGIEPNVVRPVLNLIELIKNGEVFFGQNVWGFKGVWQLGNKGGEQKIGGKAKNKYYQDVAN